LKFLIEKLKFLPIQILFLFYSLVVIIPAAWMILSSFKSSLEIFDTAWGLPSTFEFDNYVNAWINSNLGTYFFNSTYITIISVAIIVFISAMATFALTRIRFPKREILFWFFVSGLMIPWVLVLVPLFILLARLNLINSHIGLILIYIAFSIPFTVFALQPFFKAIPRELEEAAIIDGCSIYQIFWSIALPMSKSGLIIAIIFNVFGIWNEYVFGFSIIYSDSLRTLPVGIANMVVVQQYQADWGTLFAALVIAAAPVVFIYIYSQKFLSKGITGGSLKG